ncbi:MAG: pyridoxine 5'-phosphate synthase [Candidatus Omnitrophota bacterium]
MAQLGVNIDHVATIRQARKIDYPSPVIAALICQEAGADSIVCHLREDRRHIQNEDLYQLKKKINIKLNLEMALLPEIINIAIRVKPDQVTIVPEKRKELTTESGFNIVQNERKAGDLVEKLESCGIGVSFFIDPIMKHIAKVKDIGGKLIELHTGRFSEAKSKKEQKNEYNLIKKCAKFAKSIGLNVFVGHGLNYENTGKLRSITEIEEYNIGHSIVARSIFVGIKQAVKEMKAIVI